ncbi:hypothetical protein MHBO_003545, partial [Bonamia ostreae]
MDVFLFYISPMKHLFLAFVSTILALWAIIDDVLDPCFTYISIMLSFLALYKTAPSVLSSIFLTIKTSTWVIYLDYMNAILRYVNILSPVGYTFGITVQGLLKLLHRSAFLY